MTLALLALLLDVSASPSNFAELQRTVALTADGNDLVRAFVAGAGGTPIVEGTTATFLAEDDDPATVPRIVGDWSASDEREPLARLGSTRFFFRSVELHRSARLEYLLRLGGRDVPDPLNPRRVAGFGGTVVSEVRMPGYAPVVGDEDAPSVPRGQVISLEHRSAILDNTRRVHAYLPAGYDAKGQHRYPEAWLGDGTSSVESVRVPRLLDHLIAQGRLEPLVAVFVDPADRRVEHGSHAGYRRMMIEELVPRISSQYRVEGTAARRLIAGGSRGGQMAIDLCMAAPEVFGLCGAWAPAIAPRTAEEFLGPRRSVGRFALLRAPQGHTLGAWPDLTALVLLELLPGSGSAPLTSQ